MVPSDIHTPPAEFAGHSLRNIAIVNNKIKIPFDSNKLEDFFNSGFIFLILFSQTAESQSLDLDC